MLKTQTTERLKNAQFSVLVMFSIFLFYIVTASLAPYSDNIGLFIVPPVVFFFYGPFASLLYAIYRARQIKATPTDESTLTWRQLIHRNMPIFFQLLGLFTLILFLLGFLVEGPHILILPLFPFWTIELLF